MILRFWTDGSCAENPGPGGYACIVLNSNDEILKIISGNKYHSTNIEMELQAVLSALQYITQNQIHLKKHRAEIFVDCAFIVNAINEGWYHNWKNNGWRTKAGELVKNLEIWKEISKLLKVVNAVVIKTKAHSGVLYNEMADKTAKREILKLKAE